MNALEAALKIADAEINRIQLQDMRSACAMTRVDLPARIERARIDASGRLDPLEYGILQHPLTEAMLDLIRRHPELLLLKRRSGTLQL